MSNSDPLETCDKAINAVQRLQSSISKCNSNQIAATDLKFQAKGVSLAWFKSFRPDILPYLKVDDLSLIDKLLQELLDYSSRSVTKLKYLSLLKGLKKGILSIRPNLLTCNTGNINFGSRSSPPDFSTLVKDVRMVEILLNRWNETCKCITAGAPLAAMVMMGSLLESLFVAKVNSLQDKSSCFTCKTTPKDKVGTPYQLKEWTLKNYIDVFHELVWIRHTARDLSIVIRDYRNFVHPYKELTQGISIEEEDIQLMWAVFENMAKQILK